MADFIKCTDDLGRELKLPFPPKRIIPAVPSTTEFLFDLGLDDKVISRTRFCRYPKEKVERLPNVGGTKNLHVDKINLLNPDLILANEEENNKEQIESLMEEYNVYVSKVRNFEDALNNILNIGKITNTEVKAFEIANTIRTGFNNLPKREEPLRALYLIWKSPYMSVGNDTFISSMMEMCGLENVQTNPNERYPIVHDEDLKALNPDLVLLSSEPFPFQEIHKQDILKILPAARVELVDGEMFSWYESHLLKAPEYFKELIEKL
jgi:ABC-type Fe3+-hydroxamate transport system substrate-binding protein